MQHFRKHWFDLGGLLSIIISFYLFINYKHLTTIQNILWLSLISLFLHQLEEYRFPGYFPGMVNSVIYRSDQPDRYPLNTQTSVIVNVVFAWLSYGLAAIFSDKYIWLAIATMVVSLGNIVAHVFIFNIKGRTIYNPGMITSILLFLPLVIWFGNYLITKKTATATEWIIGILLGLALNIIGVFKMIKWMADKETKYIFTEKQSKLKL